jgi:hypothetical protein
MGGSGGGQGGPRFGNTAQAANPQIADPMQNLNNSGAPNFPRSTAMPRPMDRLQGIRGTMPGGQMRPPPPRTNSGEGRPGFRPIPPQGNPGLPPPTGGPSDPMMRKIELIDNYRTGQNQMAPNGKYWGYGGSNKDENGNVINTAPTSIQDLMSRLKGGGAGGK